VRFGLVHRVMTDTLAALGVLALVTGGQFSRWAAVSILVGLALALAVQESWQRHPAFRWVDTIALVATVALQGTRAALGASPLDLVIEFAAALQIIRLATRKGAAHDQQVIVLAMLHLIAGTVLGGGLGYGLCFVGVVIVAPGALVLSHLRREVEGNYRQGARDRTGLPVDVPRILRSRRVVGKGFLVATCLLSIPIFLFTALLFVAFPRVGLSFLLLNRNLATRQIGFSPRVDLGEVGVLRDNPALAMRVEIPGTPDSPPERIALHLRGTALDHYDGRAWSQSLTTRRPSEPEAAVVAIDHPVDLGADPVMRIDLEPIDPPVVFLPPDAHGFRLRPRASVLDPQAAVLRAPEGEFRYPQTDEHGVRYEVFLSPRREPTFARLAERDKPRYLQLPDDLPDRVRALAEEWTQGTQTPLEKAERIQARLREDYRYDLGSPSPKAKQPLDHFLFESKRGHCEFYSSAMAVLLRAVGVPTRNVNGFGGGTWNPIGRFYAVRHGDAHSWVEVWVDGKGWLTFDPTPPSDAAPRSEVTGVFAFLRDLFEATSQRWDRHVVNYDLAQQETLWQRLSKRRGDAGQRSAVEVARVAVPALVLVVALIALARYLWARRGGPPAAEDKPRTRDAVLAAALYEQLDQALAQVGIARSPSTPPLRHAEALARLGHPLAHEILGLTQLYLGVRFGGEELSDVERRSFEARVRQVRQWRPA